MKFVVNTSTVLLTPEEKLCYLLQMLGLQRSLVALQSKTIKVKAMFRFSRHITNT